MSEEKRATGRTEQKPDRAKLLGKEKLTAAESTLFSADGKNTPVVSPVPAKTATRQRKKNRLLAIAVAFLAVLTAVLIAVLSPGGKDDAAQAGTQEPASQADVLQAEASPTPEPASEYSTLHAAPSEANLPTAAKWKYQYGIYTNGVRADKYASDAPVLFAEGDRYTDLEGVITFRGDNFRQNGAYGSANLSRNEFRSVWKLKIGQIDSGYTVWNGVGWTGQPVLVKWPDELREKMNIGAKFKSDSELVEVIYGTLDGNIYFLDLRSGKETRSPINLGFPIKGSVSIDPRGYPLLYVGQGISKANGVTGSIGWRVYSLLDQKEIYFLDGHDPLSFRKDHGSFDGSCIINAGADTALLGGENGIFYSVKLNTVYDPDVPSVSVNPTVTAYRYKSAVTKEQGMENSIAAYGSYVWFADNTGLITCLDADTLTPVWLYDMGDDVDSTLLLDKEGETLALYAVNQVDKQGDKGFCTICRLDALSGKAEWDYIVGCSSDGTNGGGGFASPALGRGAYGGYIYFNICQTEDRGTLYCFDKRTGAVVWSKGIAVPSWSSPVLVYRPDGTGVLIVGNSGSRGRLTMYDPASGKRLGSIDLEGKIECSPAVFDDMLVLGTRGKRIYGIRLL